MATRVQTPADPEATHSTPWSRLLVTTVLVVAAADVLHFIVISEIIPPLAVGVILTAVGIALLPGRRRAGLALLGLTSLIMLAGSVPFAASHLPHPESGLDFTHSVIGTVGRVIALVAVVGAWRSTTDATARRVTTVAAGLLALTIAVAGIASFTGTGDDRGETDIFAEISDAQFPNEVRVPSAGTVFIHNRDLFRHTFTVVGTELDVEVPARRGVRFTVTLAPGSYEVICDIPGHDSMTSTLIVEG